MSDAPDSPHRPPTPDKSGRGAPASAWAFDLITVSGIPIRVHLTFVLLLGWLAFAAWQGANRISGVLFLLCIFGCVVLHEIGHSVVAQRYGIPVAEIVLYPIGGIARMEKLPKPKQELWIALAGPAVNVVIATGLFIGLQARGGLASITGMRVGDGNWWQLLMFANVALAVFNMVPAFPMDGGRVLRSLLAMSIGEVRATEIAARIGQLLAFAMGFYGFYSNTISLIFIAILVYLGAGQEVAMYRGRALVEGLLAEMGMIREFKTLPAGATLKEAADALLGTSQQDFPIVHGDEVIGVLSRQELMRGLASDGPSGYVTGSMTRNFLWARPDADLPELAATMQASQVPCALVMDDGRLVGIVTMENLAELLVMRQVMARQRRG